MADGGKDHKVNIKSPKDEIAGAMGGRHSNAGGPGGPVTTGGGGGGDKWWKDGGGGGGGGAVESVAIARTTPWWKRGLNSWNI